MRTVWQSLAWKEWHEHKWKLAALTAVLCGVSLVLVANGYYDRPHTFEGIYAMVALCTIPLAIFVGASVAASEKARGTARFLAAQPLELWQAGMLKLSAGLLTVVLPIAITFTFLFAWFQVANMLGASYSDPAPSDHIIFPLPFSFGNWFVDGGLTISWIAGCFYLWTAAFGVGRADEISAAARGGLAIALLWAAVFGTYHHVFADNGLWLRTDGQWLRDTVLTIAPGGIGMLRSEPPALTVIAALASYLGLALLFIRRFGRSLSDTATSWQLAVPRASNIDWLGPPRRSAFTAIAWKQFRESGPIVLAGLGCILLIVTVMATAMWNRLEDGHEIFEIYAGATASMGMFVTLVVGIGVMLNDCSTRLNTFWRSRPIDPDLWFWTKFGAGLVVVVASLYLPLVIAGLLGGRGEFWLDFSQPNAWLYPAVTLGIYISAVTMTALVRQAIYAATLSIAALYTGPLLVEIGSTLADRWIWDREPRLFFESENGPLMTAAMAVIALVTLLVGWLAVRYDWGRKSRY